MKPSNALSPAVLAVLLIGTPVFAQEDGSGGDGDGQEQQGGQGSQGGSEGGDAPVIDLPLLGEVPVPGFLAGLFGIESGEGDDQQQEQGPPAVVYSVAEVQSVAETFRFLGRIQPIERVDVRARVPGFIDEVAFRGGQQVEEGDLLFQIETAQYDAALQSARAQEESARAQFTTAERALARAEELRESGTVSQSQLDDAVAAFETARGTVLQAEAAVRQAELDLDYTSITAPISGRMSEPYQTQGNYVSASSNAIAELTQMDPVWGVFALGENRLIEWQQLGIGGTDLAPIAASGEEGASAGGEASPGGDGAVEVDPPRPDGDLDVANDMSEEGADPEDYDLLLLLPDGSSYADEGELSFVGNSVDPQTGTVDVRVEFSNPSGILLPNQNVTLVVTEADPPRMPVIPQSAVLLAREGRSVWVVRDDDTATQIPVEVTSVDVPGQVAVTRGLDGGERVIVRGTMALEEGAKVDPRQSSDNSGLPGASGQ
ncbi:efflux RND transporter periplasmic adaptor subunit [Palleronia sp. LCG004]|uniref:efflux RND transporter periplasmic adaptor subunit n=1 Tax=Palleronia sp. LCG004 TaxID=3079304 RepID=UPI002942AE8D|nr:efflux RND transporter periplasmic adaptor subunit [Palleronia sp. LCG004]WOI56434.1 efflux RND transporter periplasmic adaptor subunit [Palleronia sp. LCG004]